MDQDAPVVGRLLLAAITIVYLVVPYIAVRTENTRAVTAPLPFAAVFLVGYIGPPVVVLYVGPLTGAPESIGLAALAVAAATNIVVFRALVRRVRDAGYSRNLAYLTVVPLVTIACAVFLMTAPRIARDDTDAG